MVGTPQRGGREGESPKPGPRNLQWALCQPSPLPKEPRGAEPWPTPRLGGINLNQLITSERSHQRLNKHNLTEGMIIDLVKKRKKGKLN
jgi:hypothetical protein